MRRWIEPLWRWIGRQYGFNEFGFLPTTHNNLQEGLQVWVGQPEKGVDAMCEVQDVSVEDGIVHVELKITGKNDLSYLAQEPSGQTAEEIVTGRITVGDRDA